MSMTAFFLAMTVVVGLIFVLVLGPLVLSMIPRGRTSSSSAGGGAPASPPAGPARAWYASPWVVVPGLVLVAGGLWYVVATSDDVMLSLGVLVILGIAIVGAVKGKGNGAAWVTGLVMLCLLGFLGHRFYYGPEAAKVTEKWQQENYKAAMDPKPPADSSQRSASASTAVRPFGGPITVPVSSEWGAWVEGGSDRCVWIFRINPHTQMQVRLDRYEEAISWARYLELVQQNKVSAFQAFRLRSDGTSTSETYEWRRPGTCS